MAYFTSLFLTHFFYVQLKQDFCPHALQVNTVLIFTNLTFFLAHVPSHYPKGHTSHLHK